MCVYFILTGHREHTFGMIYISIFCCVHGIANKWYYKLIIIVATLLFGSCNWAQSFLHTWEWRVKPTPVIRRSMLIVSLAVGEEPKTTDHRWKHIHDEVPVDVSLRWDEIYSATSWGICGQCPIGIVTALLAWSSVRPNEEGYSRLTRSVSVLYMNISIQCVCVLA